MSVRVTGGVRRNFKFAHRRATMVTDLTPLISVRQLPAVIHPRSGPQRNPYTCVLYSAQGTVTATNPKGDRDRSGRSGDAALRLLSSTLHLFDCRTPDFLLASNAGYWKNKGDTSIEQSMTRDCGLVRIMLLLHRSAGSDTSSKM